MDKNWFRADKNELGWIIIVFGLIRAVWTHKGGLGPIRMGFGTNKKWFRADKNGLGRIRNGWRNG